MLIQTAGKCEGNLFNDSRSFSSKDMGSQIIPFDAHKKTCDN